MDIFLVAIVGSSIVVIGLIIFSLLKLSNSIKLLEDNTDKTSIETVDSINRSIKEFSENITNQQVLDQELIKKSILNIDTLINEKSNKFSKLIDETIEKLNSNNDKTKLMIIDEIKSLNTKVLSIFDDIKIDSKSLEKDILENTNNVLITLKNEIKSLDTNVESIFDNLKTDNKSLEKNMLENTDNIVITVKKELELLDTKLVTTFREIKNDTSKIKNISEKHGLNIKNQLENSFQNTIQLVNNLRLDNLINLSNEISKYKNGSYEDEYFLQEVGYCKIIKVTDKKNGEITNVYYDDNGEKSHTETYQNEVLKYSMKYENNKLKIGTEFDVNAKTSFEYFYDDMEEITKKIEYIYDSNLKVIDKIENEF